MHARISLTLLLASLIAIFSSDAVVDAAPIKRNTGTVSLPLRRVEPRSGVHPQVMYQQHVNRAHIRLSRMTGTQEPSARELESNLVKRILLAGEAETAKRYNRGGIGHDSKRYNRHGIRESYSFQDLEGAEGVDGIISATNGTGSASSAADGSDPSIGVGGGGTSDSNTPNLTPANKPTAPNSLGLDIEANDVGYIATVQFGTPPRDFSILMDSGSADLWVGSEDCQSENGGGCGNHQFLGPQSSTSFKSSTKQFTVQYGTGAVSGQIVQDLVTVAGLQLGPHIFGTASQETADFSDNSVSFDGLMGLAQSTLSEQQTLTPVEAMAKQGLIQEAITSYKISRLADDKNDGEITFGGLDQSKFDPKTLTTLDNVSKNGFWEAAMPAVTVGGKDSGLQGRTAIIDTGTTLIVAPATDANAVHALIAGAKSDGQGGFTIPCNTTTQVSLKFGTQAFNIDPRDLAFAPVSNDPNGDCLSGISSGNVGGANEWLVGDVFLKNAYFSTDVTKNQLSLAQLV